MGVIRILKISLWVGIAIILASCDKKVKAGIAADKAEVTVNENVTFTNASINADAYEWDFGDDTYSSEKSPSHSWGSPGIYVIKMTACKKQGHGPQRHFGGNPCETTSISIRVN